MSAQSRVEFAQWLKDNHPALFQRAIAIATNSENALGSLGQNGTNYSVRMGRQVASMLMADLG